MDILVRVADDVPLDGAVVELAATGQHRFLTAEVRIPAPQDQP